MICCASDLFAFSHSCSAEVAMVGAAARSASWNARAPMKMFRFEIISGSVFAYFSSRQTGARPLGSISHVGTLAARRAAEPNARWKSADAKRTFVRKVMGFKF